MPPPCIAIVGRPNVGKSTLFNRLTGQRQAIVWKERGTTRDRLYATVTWNGVTFRVVDTGGYDPEGRDLLHAQLHRQIARASDEAVAILLVCDGQQGITPGDEDVVSWVRKAGKPVLLAVNKVDDQHTVSNDAEFFRWGFGAPRLISATHGRGIADLLDALAEVASCAPVAAAAETPAVRLAIVGRPNVGKSTLYNWLVHDERAIVSPEPGTTRDALDTLMIWNGAPVLLIDTAGLRHRRKLSHPVELFSQARTVEAIQRCDAAFIVMDATDTVANDDQRIIQRVLEAGKGCLILANKWDRIRGITQDAFIRQWQHALAFASCVPILCVSAPTGRAVSKAMTLAPRIAQRRLARVQTATLNACLQAAFQRHRPGLVGRTPIKFFYATQVETAPPTFVLFVNRPEHVTRNYLHYLDGALRQRFDLEGVPLQLRLRKRSGADA